MHVVLVQLENVTVILFIAHLNNSGDVDMNQNLVVVIKFEPVVM